MPSSTRMPPRTLPCRCDDCREDHGRKRRVSKNKSCTSGEATKKREISVQQKRGEIQVKIIALAAPSLSPRSFPQAHFSRPRELPAQIPLSRPDPRGPHR
jgi:hypothetical protein